MKTTFETEFLDYYKAFCEITIWFRKIVAHTNKKAFITVEDIEKELVVERNRILSFIPAKMRPQLRKLLDKIADEYYSRISNWSMSQKITKDMV